MPYGRYARDIRARTVICKLKYKFFHLIEANHPSALVGPFSPLPPIALRFFSSPTRLLHLPSLSHSFGLCLRKWLQSSPQLYKPLCGRDFRLDVSVDLLQDGMGWRVLDERYERRVEEGLKE